MTSPGLDAYLFSGHQSFKFHDFPDIFLDPTNPDEHETLLKVIFFFFNSWSGILMLIHRLDPSLTSIMEMCLRKSDEKMLSVGVRIQLNAR